ncbi:MAG: antibiotic biosynthesis monooxygenase family protein [Candidatus Promineifilaceae bacterium]
MITVMNRLPVNPEYNDAFEQRFEDRASLVDKMDGFISYQLLRPSKDGDPYIVMTHWESDAHFRAWTNSDEFKQGHSRAGQLPREAFLAHPQLEIHEVIQHAQSGEIL